MHYKSTRDASKRVTASQAILEGLSQDGGLYVPMNFPQLQPDWEKAKDYTYQEMAEYVLTPYLGDFTAEQIRHCVQSAYDEKFDTALIAPLVQEESEYFLELFHGPTLAFKDMALSILPYLLKTSAEINQNDAEIVILTATSGDTGKAAMEGFADVPGTKIIVFYPEGGVSPTQERQMLTQRGANTFVRAVRGNFDDAQTKVKELFNDPDLRADLARDNIQFSSANSMNIGRLLPQVVYYYYAYAQLLRQDQLTPGDYFNVCVPTGNFGNILAAYYAQQMGLPIRRLICASNDNKVLYDFFQTSTYNRQRDFVLTVSPSMDILVSSNFERMLYHAIGEDTDQLIQLMEDLDQAGSYHIESDGFKDFIGEYATEAETKEEIHQVAQETDYVIDPHTAVASKAWRKANDRENFPEPTVVVSTASPYKFPAVVLEALGVEGAVDGSPQIFADLYEKSQVSIPPAIQELYELDLNPKEIIDIDQMQASVESIVRQ